MGGLTNGYIHNLLRDKLVLSQIYMDVYASDTVEVTRLKRKKHFIFICNLSKASEKGTHFVCVVGKPTSIIYIDSLGLNVNMSPILHEQLRLIDRPISCLVDTPIQSQDSLFCGFYCIFFACLFDINRFPNASGLLLFDKTDRQNNDAICTSNLKTLIKNNVM